MSVQEVVFSYTTQGAKAAQRADQGVRRSVRETGRVANRQAGRVERWMTRNRRAIQGLAVATLGAATAILSASPTMRAELSGLRTAFTLFADTIVRELLPGAGSLSQAAVNAALAFRNLGQDVKIFTGVLSVAGVVFGAVATAATAPIGALAGLAAGFATLVLKFNSLGAEAKILASILTGLFLPVWAALLEFIRGTFAGGVEEGIRRMEASLRDSVSAFQTIFSNILGAFARFIVSLLSLARDRFAALRDSAIRWGQNVVRGFIDGIENMMGALRSKITELAQVIRDRLPFSPAKVGPLSDLDQAGPGMVDTLASGMEQGRGRLANASANVAGGMGAGLGGGQNVQIDELNVEVTSTGSPERDGQRVAREVRDTLGRDLGGRGV